MPISSAFDTTRDCFRMSLTNPISVDELVAGYEAVIAHPSFHDDAPSIWDLQALDLGKIPLNDIRQLPRRLGPLVSGRLVEYPVALVTNGGMHLQLLRVYLAILKLIGSNIRIRLFTDMNLAEQWVARINGTDATQA